MRVPIAEKVKSLRRPAAIEALHLASRYLSEARNSGGLGAAPDVVNADAGKVARDIVASIEKAEGKDLVDLSREQILPYTNEISNVLSDYTEGSVSTRDVDSVLSALRSTNLRASKISPMENTRVQIRRATDILMALFTEIQNDELESFQLNHVRANVVGDERPFDVRPGHYTKFEQQILNDRLQDIKTAYRSFKAAKLDQHQDVSFELNTSIIITVCGLFMNDVKIFKLANLSAGTDNTFRAASIARWIAKLRPIQWEQRGEFSHSPETMFVNEDFATFIFFLYLEYFNVETFSAEGMQRLVLYLRHLFVHSDPNLEAMRTIAFVTQELFLAWRETRG
jgi:hypothetical protein